MNLYEKTNYLLGEEKGNLVAGGFYYLNPTLSELQLLRDQDENDRVRVGMTDDGTIYAWQASTIFHGPFAKKLGIEFLSGSTRHVPELHKETTKESFQEFLDLMKRFYPNIDLSNKMVDDIPKKKKRLISMDWMKYI